MKGPELLQIDARRRSRDRALLFLTGLAFYFNLDLVLGAFPLHIVDLGGSQREVGFLMGAFSLAAIFARPGLAKLLDKRGPRPVLWLAVLTGTIGPLLYLTTTSLGWLGIIRVVHAVVPAGFVMTLTLMLVDRVHEDYRGRIIGLFGILGGISLLGAPAIGLSLMASGGMPLVVGASGLLGVVALFAVWGVQPLPEEERTKISEIQPSPAPATPEGPMRPVVPLSLLALNMLVTYNFGMSITFASVYGIDLNVANPGIFFTSLAIGVMISRYLSGRAIDMHGVRVIGPISFGLITVGMVLLAGAKGLGAFVSGAFFVGAGFGSTQTLLWTALVATAPASSRAMATAWFNNAFDVGGLLGSVIGGLIAEEFGYAAMYGVGAVVSVVGLALWQRTKGGWRQDFDADGLTPAQTGM